MLVTNQVTTRFDDNQGGVGAAIDPTCTAYTRSPLITFEHARACVFVRLCVCVRARLWFVSGDAFVTAALGNTWAHSVNTRITVNYGPDTLRCVHMLGYEHEGSQRGEGGGGEE